MYWGLPWGARMFGIRRGKVILVAEDEVLLHNMVRRMLENAGFTVLAASDGAEALRISREYPTPIDLLLTDVQMPSMDGIALAEHIVRERPDTAIVIMSSEMGDRGESL